MIDFNISTHDAELVDRIIERAGDLDLICDDQITHELDLIATHLNSCPIDFQRLLDANDFKHDFCGIYRHLDRETGKLTSCFLPRFRKREVQ